MPWLLSLVACIAPQSMDGAPHELVVTHLDRGEVLRFDGEGAARPPVVGVEAAREVEGVTGRPFAPSVVTPTPDGWWVADFVTGAVLGFDETGAFTEVVRETGSGSGRVEEPCALVADEDGILLLGNDSGNVVSLAAADDEAVLGVPVPLRHAHGLEREGDLAWVGRSATEPGAGQVQRFDLRRGEHLGDFATLPEVTEATAVRLVDGELWVVDFFQGRITAWDPASGSLLGEVASGLEGPIDVEVDGEGTAWVLDREGVLRVDPASGEARRVVGAEQMGEGWARDLLIR